MALWRLNMKVTIFFFFFFDLSNEDNSALRLCVHADSLWFAVSFDSFQVYQQGCSTAFLHFFIYIHILFFSLAASACLVLRMWYYVTFGAASHDKSSWKCTAAQVARILLFCALLLSSWCALLPLPLVALTNQCNERWTNFYNMYISMTTQRERGGGGFLAI